jgi:hypothetical protein
MGSNNSVTNKHMLHAQRWRHTFEGIVLVCEQTQNTRQVHIEVIEKEPINIVLKALDHGRKFSRRSTQAYSSVYRSGKHTAQLTVDNGELVPFVALCLPLCQ